MLIDAIAQSGLRAPSLASGRPLGLLACPEKASTPKASTSMNPRRTNLERIDLAISSLSFLTSFHLNT
eukprot:5289515-Pyramimonas_sp.AAC.1